jgi:putative spermidine/putrescine transport system substrate-binding protein
VLAWLPPAPAHAADLTMVSWGGAYTRSQILAFVRPYEAQTGIQLEVLDYSGGLEELRSQVRSLNIKWDIVDLELSDALRACREGLLEHIPAAALAAAPDGTAPKDDFIKGALTDCAVGTVVWSTAIAYDPKALPSAPQRLRDFFDTRRFPGRRALRRTPKANLEWALIASGVPADEVYARLETEAGLQQAFAVLDEIKPELVWWEAGLEAPHLLESGQVVMASAYNGRIQDANAKRGAGLAILWDRQIWNIDLFGIPKGNPRREQALNFIRFATASERLADQARYIPYGPVRRSSLAFLGPDIRPHLPTSDENFRTALRIDALWWAEHFERINRRFEEWLAQPLQVPRRLPR